MEYVIDYGYGKAALYTPYPNVKERFMTLAGTCYELRNKLAKFKIVGQVDAEPEKKEADEFERLKFWNDEGRHVCVYIWREDGARKQIRPLYKNGWHDWNEYYCTFCKNERFEQISMDLGV